MAPGFLANPAWVAADVLAEVWAPPPPLDFERWATENVSFGKESRFPGPYDPDRFPHFREILQALTPDDPAPVVALKGSAQIGKTVLAQIFMGGSLAMDPGPFLVFHPTEPNATRWARQKLKPFLRGTPSLADLFPAVGARDGSSSMLYRERRDGLGYVQAIGANSEANLSQTSAPRQVQDDLAKWRPNEAGDPELQADNRSRAFWDRKIFKISTPLIWPGCRITRAFNEGTQEYYHLPCPHCATPHPLIWENFRVPEEDSDDLPHFVCPHCGGEILQTHRPAMLAGGRWVAERPGAVNRSFCLWSAYSPTEEWASIAAGWRAARGDAEAEQTFFNDTLGLAYETAGEAPPWEALRDRADAMGLARGVVPEGGLLLVLACDVQQDRVEVHLKAFGRDRRRWTVDYFVVPGGITEESAHEGLDGLFERAWPDFRGGARKVDLLAIDGNAWTNEVWDWIKRKPPSRAIMVRGANGDLAPVIAKVNQERRRDGKPKRYLTRFYNVGVSGLKTSLYEYLRKDDPAARGFCFFPAGMGEEFFKQLTSERRRPKRLRNGGTHYVWESNGERAEVLDTEVYAAAAAEMLGWRHNSDADWDRLTAEREAPLPRDDLGLDIPGAEIRSVAGRPLDPAERKAEDRYRAIVRRLA